VDEFSKLAELTEDAEKKREFFLRLHGSAQNLSKKIVFVLAEPPSIFSVFEEPQRDDSTISEIAEAISDKKVFYLNGLSPHEKMNLFCLKKTQNHGQDMDETTKSRMNDLLQQLSGIPLEIQIAGAAFFSNPKKEIKEILKDVGNSFKKNLKPIILPTMNTRQLVFIRHIIEYEIKQNGLPLDRIKKRSQGQLEYLKNFGFIKKESDKLVKFTSEPIRSILKAEMDNLSRLF